MKCTTHIEQDLAKIVWYKTEYNTVKPLNSGHLRALKNLSVIKRCPLLGGSLTKIVTFGTKHFVRYSRHVRYLGCPLLGGFIVLKNVKFLFCHKSYVYRINFRVLNKKHYSMNHFLKWHRVSREVYCVNNCGCSFVAKFSKWLL